MPGKYFEQEQEAQANLPACELVLTGAPERKKAMRHAQPQRDRILQRNQVPDGVLVGQALAGDQAAFDSLVNRYHHHLMGFIRGMLKDRDQCYDVLQHVYLQLYLSLPTLSKSVSLKPWLVQVARNRCLDELRRRHRRPEVLFSTLEREQRGEGLSPLEAIPASGGHADCCVKIPCIKIKDESN